MLKNAGYDSSAILSYFSPFVSVGSRKSKRSRSLEAFRIGEMRYRCVKEYKPYNLSVFLSHVSPLDSVGSRKKQVRQELTDFRNRQTEMYLEAGEGRGERSFKQGCNLCLLSLLIAFSSRFSRRQKKQVNKEREAFEIGLLRYV